MKKMYLTETKIIKLDKQNLSNITKQLPYFILINM